VGKLQDILRDGAAERLRQSWDSTAAAGELAPLPPGEYTAHIIAGTLETARTRGTPGYKLTFRVCEGEYTGRQFWHDIWLTEAALPMAKRDLAKLGVTSLDQLDHPLPRGIRCRCKLVLRRGDDGAEFNKLRTFAVVGIDAPEADAFAPPDGPPGEGTPTDPTAGAAELGDAAEPPAAEAATDPNAGAAAMDGTPSTAEGNDSGAAGDKPPF
jgi:hypothetical protein